MAKFKITVELLELALFGELQPKLEVNILGCKYDPNLRILELDIAGKDVPNAEAVRAICSDSKSDRGRIRSIEFEAIE